MKKILAVIAIMFIAAARLFSQDIIVMMTPGTYIKAKIKEIGINEIIYKKSNDRFGPSLSVFKSDVAMIIYANGNVVVYNKSLQRSKEDSIAADSIPRLDADKCDAGKNDAIFFHGKMGAHFALGFCFGPFAIAGTLLLADPNPVTGRRTEKMSEHKKLFNDPTYLNCYRKKARKRMLLMDGLGWLSFIMIVAIPALVISK
jgi:hypothetical protein